MGAGISHGIIAMSNSLKFFNILVSPHFCNDSLTPGSPGFKASLTALSL
jgi:hypothetical protein